MKQSIGIVLALFLLGGCQSGQGRWPDGSWEGVAALDGVPFFISLDIEQGQVFASIPEMLITRTSVQSSLGSNGQLHAKLILGPSSLEMVLTEESDKLIGKVIQNTSVGRIELHPKGYRKIHRIQTRPSREGEAVALKTPFGIVHGTFLVPDTKKPVAAVLLIAGSGPTDRDGNSEIMVENNDMLWHLAQQLREANIASLRYDKMGVGESQFSEGFEEKEYTFDDSVAVAQLLLAFLKADSRVDNVGVIGHSEGSLTALLSAAKMEVDFVISLAGNADPIDEQLVKQVQRVNQEAALVLSQRLEQIARSEYQKTGNALVDALVMEGSEAYLARWMAYNPSEILQTNKAPALVIKGDCDERLLFEDDWFSETGMPDHVQFKIIRGMSHLLKEVDTPADVPRTYRERTLAVHPELIELITTYIRNF